jgi:branched-chain amino acid transport system substrate-binding protein
MLGGGSFDLSQPVPSTHMPFLRLQPVRRLAVLGLAALCGCQPAPPIKVAFIGGLTGRVSELAIDGRNGVELAVETLNAQGGDQYELRVHDDGRVVLQGPAAIDAVVDDGAAFAIGPMTSVLAQGMVSEAAKRHLVLISPTANSDELAGIDDYFFRVIPSAGPGAEQFADAAIARGLRSASVMMEWHNRTYSEGFAKKFSARFESLGGAPPHLVHYETDQSPDYAQIAAALLATHPKIVLLVCSSPDAAIAAQQLRRLDPDVKLAIASWAANLQLLQLAGRAAEGALVLQALDLDSQIPAYLDFRKRFVARFGNPPSQAAVFSYEAAMLGAQGLRRKTQGQSLRDVLREPGQRWPGLQQPVVLDRFGDSLTRFRLSEVRDGRYVMLPS